MNVCVCVCVFSFGCTPFPKLSRSVPTSVAIATVPLWNRPGPLQCHSGAALGENEKHRSSIYWVMVQMEKIQNAGMRCRLLHLGSGSMARIAAFTASASGLVSMFRYFQSFTSSDRVSQYTVAVRFIQFGTSHKGLGATQSSVRSHSAGVT